MYLIRNLSRNPETKRIRAQRNGRWTSFMLDSGMRIRRKGPRYTEIDESALRANLGEIVWGIEEGYIEVFSSEEKPLSIQDIKSLFEKKEEPKVSAPVKEEPSKEKIQEPNDPDIKTKPNDPDIKDKETPVESTVSRPVQVFSKKRSHGA